MKMVTLNTRQDGLVTIFINGGNLAVFEGPDGKVCVMDGLHNNGGWQVKETYKEVMAMIQAA